jgi:hypothetical protein
MWSIGEMVVTDESRSTRRKTSPSVTLSIKNSTWTGLGSNPVIRGNRPETKFLSHGTASENVDILGGLTGACYVNKLYRFST